MTQQEVMKTFIKSLDDTEMSGRSALDEAIKKSSDFGSYQEVVSKLYADWQEAGNWHTFLVRYCGIILDNKDTGAISGSDTGGATSKGATDIIPVEGDAKYPDGTSFTIDGLTIYGIPPKDELTKDQQYIVQGLYSWWLKAALAVIKENYGLTFAEENTTNSRLRLKFYEDTSSGTLTSVSFNSINGTKKEFESRILSINMAYFKNMSSSDRHGTIGSFTLDRILTHELVHSIMASNVNYFSDLPGAIVEGGTAEIIHGIDDMRYDEIIEYAKNISTLISALSTEVMLSNSVYAIYTSGYIFMRYFLKQAADTTFDYDTYQKKISVNADNFVTNYWDEVTISGSNGADTITNSGEKVLINGKNGANTIKNYSDYVTITGGAEADSISNSGSNVKINSSSGVDNIDNEGSKVTIRSGVGNDKITNSGSDVTIKADAGNDSIINSSDCSNVSIYGDNGLDTIDNSSAGAFISGGKGIDRIINKGSAAKIRGDANDDVIENGDDNIASIGANSTIYGGAGNDSIKNYGTNVIIYGDNGNDKIRNDSGNTTLYGGAGNDTFTNYGDEVCIYGNAGNDSVYNCGAWTELNGDSGADYFYNEGTAVYISGNAGNDSIYNFGDHVSISGDAGNDYIENDGGKHIMYNFGRSSGKDTIVGFNANDTIKITSGGYSAVTSGDDVIVSIGKNSMLLKNAASLEINFIDAAGEEKIWFAEENNFATADNLDALVKKDLASIALNESVNAENFAQNTLLAYSEK